MGRWVVVGVVAAVAVSVALPGLARPQYLKGFVEEYPSLTAGAKGLKCKVCHCAAQKAAQNDYGAAVKKELGAKNVKDKEAIAKALRAAEEYPSAVKGRTFGDLIREGKLPSPCPP